MFGNRIDLFKLFGFSVRIDLSWLIIAGLITWSLAVGFFPSAYRGLPASTYWWMGILGALGLFASVVIHEFAHSLVARRFGLPMKGITLFIFGGVAEMEEEASDPKTEFLMAAAGPASSIVIGLLLYAVSRAPWPLPALGILRYLAFINLALAVFNLIPAFPLDGGRILRSALWAWKGRLRWATRIASQIGAGFGWVLIILGAFSIFNGSLFGGMWWILIGLFLRNAATMSYQQLLIRRALEGEPVSRFMQRDPIVVPPELSLASLVQDFMYRYHHKMFPVVEDGRLVGCITTRQVREVPQEEWESRAVASVLKHCAPENTISVKADAVQALSRMNENGVSRLMVVDRDRLAGVVALKDLMGLLAIKMELFEELGPEESRPADRYWRQRRVAPQG